MVLTRNESIGIAGCAAAAAVIGIALVVKVKTPITPPTSFSMSLSASPTTLPSDGGDVAITGSTGNISDGTSVSIVVNGSTVDVEMVSNAAFSYVLSVPENTTTIPETVTIQATATVSGVAVSSNVVTVTVMASTTPPPSLSITLVVSPTSLPYTGGNVSLTGSTTNMPDGTPVIITANGRTIDTLTVVDSAFSGTYSVPENTSTSPENIVFHAIATVNSNAVSSNTATVTVAVSTTPPPSPSMTLSVSPTTLPSTGGNGSLTGATSNIPDYTAVTITANGRTFGDLVVMNGAFATTYNISANTSTSPETITFQATATVSGVTVNSNTATVTVAGALSSGTVSVTIQTDADATVTVDGHSGKADSSGSIIFTLQTDSTYTAKGSLTVTQTIGRETCAELYEGTTTFTTGTASETVQLPLTMVSRKCITNGYTPEASIAVF